MYRVPTDRDRKFFGKEFDFGYRSGAAGLTLAESQADMEKFLARDLRTCELCPFGVGWFEGNKAHVEYVREHPEPVEVSETSKEAA